MSEEFLQVREFRHPASHVGLPVRGRRPHRHSPSPSGRQLLQPLHQDYRVGRWFPVGPGYLEDFAVTLIGGLGFTDLSPQRLGLNELPQESFAFGREAHERLRRHLRHLPVPALLRHGPVLRGQRAHIGTKPEIPLTDPSLELDRG